MTPEYVINICRQAIETTLMCAAPMLIVALAIGLIISIFQAATQINEQTMTFIPKIVGVFVTLLLFAPWILQKASAFLITIFNQLPIIGQ
jgi:flagellar biosynthetic protein FliQ